MTNKRLIIDVTQLVHWQGHLTGIPRVIDEIAKRYISYDHAIFVTWDSAKQTYLQVDLLATNKIRGKGICYVRRDGTTYNPLEHSVVRAARLAKGSNVVVAKSLQYLKYAYRKAKASPIAPTNFQTIQAANDDSLLIIWGEWHDLAFINMVTRAAKEGASVAQVVHDMLPIIAPQFSGSGNATKTMAVYNEQILPFCKVVFCVSENTKNDVVAWLKSKNLHVPTMILVRNGDDLTISKSKAPHEPAFKSSGLGDGAPFILSVGTLEARKNRFLLYYVWKLAKSRGIKLPKLVIVGRKGWRNEDMYGIMTEDPDTKGAFVFLHDASDEELEWLYRHCLFTIYPSFYEGWGIPVAESIRRGVPAIASKTSSIPEIVGDMVQYFDPCSTDECLALLVNLLDPKQRAKAKNALIQYKPFSWDETFRQFDNVLREYYV